MKLFDYIIIYFNQYLPQVRGVSDETKKTYMESFSLFLTFSAQYLSVPIKELKIEDLTLELIFAFLLYLEEKRGNVARTRNNRLAALKSFARMVRLMYPEYRKIAEMILNIPQKKWQKRLIGYMTPDELLDVFESVDLNKKEGFRDYTILHLLNDSGARASEVASLKLDYFNPDRKSLVIIGKGNRYRLINLETKTVGLLVYYIREHRVTPKPLYRGYLFINQRREKFTRHGIYRICKKYLLKSISSKRIKWLSAVHSFRHTCAINMLSSGKSITEIQNRLGHEKVDTTANYLKLNIFHKKEIQERLIKYTQSNITSDPKVEELFDGKDKDEILDWLDNL